MEKRSTHRRMLVPIHRRIFTDIVSANFEKYASSKLNWVDILEDVTTQAKSHPEATNLDYVTSAHIMGMVKTEAKFRGERIAPKKPKPESVIPQQLKQAEETVSELRKLVALYAERLDTLEEAINSKTGVLSL